MKVVIIMFSALCMCHLTSTGQITKNNWLFGGTMGFSSSKYSNLLGSITYTDIRIAGTAGYFIKDKLAVGLKPNVLFERTKNTLNNVSSDILAIGPFVRYYVLPEASKTNLFFEGDYAYGTNGLTYQVTRHSSAYSIFMGPEFFLNSSVGLELSFGFTHVGTSDAVNNKADVFQVGIGFQFHLEKEQK